MAPPITGEDSSSSAAATLNPTRAPWWRWKT